jgi:DNA-binding transcriptional ArsR family regulator
MKHLLMYLIAGTRGGHTRARIIDLILEKPSNANKVASGLKLDYKTVQHHLKVLEKNNILYAVNKDSYGAVYFITEIMQANVTIFKEIWAQSGKK